MPNEVLLFGASALFLLVVGTLVGGVFWLLHGTPLARGLAPQPVTVRVKRLFDF